ncbi:MAG: hypothetical protein AAGG48_29020 [Planctomycetota bacterium]
MTELSIPQMTGLFVALFLLGKATSTTVYQLCWRNALGRDLQRLGPTAWLLLRWKLLPIHALVLCSLWQVSWTHASTLRAFTLVWVCLMGWATVLRFSAIDLQRFFLKDRLFVVLLGISTWFSPVFVYPFAMVCCCLQYVVSQSPLSPGYSNLLGFEFIRGTLCTLLASLVFTGVFRWTLGTPLEIQPLIVAVIIGFQASYYVNHALAKSWLGPKWYSWILHNRVECLFVNSFLRGWGASLGKNRVLRFANCVSRFRVPVCGAMWTLEFAFVAILIEPRYAMVLYGVVTVFHISVWILTGLAELEHIVNHLGIVCLFATADATIISVFGPWMLIASLASMILCIAWVGMLRTKMHREYEDLGDSRLAGISDPFDHLMAWWDSPLMRMFTFVVTTIDGKQWSLPVTKSSPYDTAITDIHTHIMLLNQHPGFDLNAQHDKRLFRTGVWGLVISTMERDALYTQMANGLLDTSFSADVCSASNKPWIFPAQVDLPNEVMALKELFTGMNKYQALGWFRIVMRYPHFPGEDFVPDICPLVNQLPEFAFDRPMTSVLIQRIKTFYTGNQIHVLEQSDVGTIHLQ